MRWVVSGDAATGVAVPANAIDAAIARHAAAGRR